jgi:hypothetical protein
MSEEEFNTFNLVCDSDKYAYGYYINALEQYIVSMKEEVLYRVKKALETYISKFEFDFESEIRKMNREEWNFYYSVKKLLKGLQDEDYYEEW